MDKLNYCVDCLRVFDSAEGCTFCNSKSIKELVKNAPVNVIGSKLKGRVLNAKQGAVQVLFTDESKTKTIREYEASKLKKIL